LAYTHGVGVSPRVSSSARSGVGLLLVACAAFGCAGRAPSVGPQLLAERSSCGLTAAPAGLPFGRPITSSTGRGESHRQASCVREEAPECVYRFEVAERSDLRASLLSADFDGALSLLGGDGMEDELSCVDDLPIGDTHHARLDVSLAPGSYLLVVDGASGDGGRFELFAELEPLPALARTCAAAPVLEEGVYVRGSTRGGASMFAASCGAKAGGADEVYRFDLDQPARVRIREHGDFDAVLALRSECAEPASELACSDDGVDGHLMLSAELAAGRYFVVADAYARGEGGDYVLALERAEPRAPIAPAAACAEARTIEPDGARHELDTLYAASALSGSCGGEGAPEAVFRFKLPRRSLVSAELSQLELNAALFVRRSCEDAASELGCSVIPRTDRDFAPLPAPRKALALELDAGDYVLVVDGQRGLDMGAATLQLSAAPAAP
jgi:hypothetical protein